MKLDGSSATNARFRSASCDKVAVAILSQAVDGTRKMTEMSGMSSATHLNTEEMSTVAKI
jgi:hypothetical protein